MQSSGLEPLLTRFGVAFDPLVVFERDPAAALPSGLGGEVFFAAPARHEITRGLLVEGDASQRVLLSLAQALRTAEPSRPLLSTTERAVGVSKPSALSDPETRLSDVEPDRDGPFAVAASAELDGPDPEARKSRLVVLGSPSPLLGASFQDPALAATRRFVESSVAWLTERPALVHLPEKPARQVGMHLTEEALSELARYVMIYMPLTALALGALVMLRRRHTPREKAGEGGGE